jgi:anion-transporting  ArsA/GET3 family ATPase
VRELAAILRDRTRSRFIAVTLPEPLPDYETGRLLRDLKKLEAPLGAVFVNRVLMEGDAGCARCKLAVQWQNASLAKLRKHMRDAEILLTREFESPIAGAPALRQFTRALWQVKPHP